MYRGTTPTLTFALPFQAGIIKNLFITFSQKGQIVLEKTTADCGLIGNTIELNLTQEDTLKFMPGNAELQVRIIDNSKCLYIILMVFQIFLEILNIRLCRFL